MTTITEPIFDVVLDETHGNYRLTACNVAKEIIDRWIAWLPLPEAEELSISCRFSQKTKGGPRESAGLVHDWRNDIPPIHRANTLAEVVKVVQEEHSRVDYVTILHRSGSHVCRIFHPRTIYI